MVNPHTKAIADSGLQDSNGSGSDNIDENGIQGLTKRLKLVELSYLELWAEVCKLTNRVAEIESKNLIVK